MERFKKSVTHISEMEGKEVKHVFAKKQVFHPVFFCNKRFVRNTKENDLREIDIRTGPTT